MEIRRRDFIMMTACGLAVSRRAITAIGPTPGPILWSVKGNGGNASILGFSDAKDRSWFTPSIEHAFRESKEVWFETPLNRSSGGSSQDGSSSVEQELGYDNQRSLFEVLGPQLTDRTLRVATELGVPRENLEHLRPWLAYIVLNDAFRKRFGLPSQGESPDGVLAEMAAATGKPIHSEFPTDDDVLRFFAKLSDKAQREHLEDLLDYVRDEKKGRNQANYGWVVGHPDPRFINAMRSKRPALYETMHVRRNGEWAERISGLLSAGGVHFICVGLNHTLGPDSIPRQLERHGLRPRRV